MNARADVSQKNASHRCDVCHAICLFPQNGRNTMWSQPKRQCDITNYADTYFSSQKKSPFSNKNREA